MFVSPAYAQVAGGSGGGAGRSGGNLGPLNIGGQGLQPAQSQPTPATQYGNPGHGPGRPNTGGGGGAGGGGPRTTPNSTGGAGQPINITGSSIVWGAGSPAPPGRGGSGSTNPGAPGRGGGAGHPGSVIIRYIKG